MSETTTGLIYKLDPNSMSTSDLSLYVNNGISLTPSEDFNTINGGLTTDDEGISCIRVMRGDRLTINHRLFADDPESVRMILRQLAERIGKTNQDYMDAAEVVRKAKEDRTINAASDTTPRTALQRLHDYYLSFLRR